MKIKPSDVAPEKGDKYSPRLHRFLQRRGARTNNVYKDHAGALWIGEVNGQWFTGCRLMSILCGTRGASRSYAFPGAPRQWKLKELKNFWTLYLKHGRCAIDPDHDKYFVGDAGRFVRRGRTRCCQWCGQKQKVKIERQITQHERWSNIPSPL